MMPGEESMMPGEASMMPGEASMMPGEESLMLGGDVGAAGTLPEGSLEPDPAMAPII